MTTAYDTLGLAELEGLEYRAVDLLARPVKPEIRQRLTAALSSVRAAKARFLVAHPDTIRKSATAAEPKGRRVFESMHHAGMDLLNNSSAGMRVFSIPANGRIDLAEGDHAGHAFLRGRGFRDCGMKIEDTSKASAATLDRFRAGNLERLSGLAFAGGRLR